MLSQKDKLLLDELQSNFPISARPYRDIAVKFGLREEEVMQKIKLFQKKGIIRYIAGVFNLKKLGLVSGLIALSVPRRDLARVVRIINSYPQVSHNYLRKDKFNLWFTLSASSKRRLLDLVREIKERTGINHTLDLFTLKVFKIDARFKGY